MPLSRLGRAASGALAAPFFAFSGSVLANTNPEIEELRRMLEDMRARYEQQIDSLEARLAAAERQAAQSARRSEAAAARAESAARQAAAEAKPMTAPVVMPANTSVTASSGDASRSHRGSAFGAITSGTAFNPQISAILDGNYYHDDLGGDGSALVGEAFQPGLNRYQDHDHGDSDDAHDHGHAHGTAANGFNFREAELTFSATVDPYFDAALYLSVDGDGNVELEEGYFETRSLPYGLKVKGGKFLSDFGYINRQHPHQWDFVDQNLPYLNLLGVHGLQDVGLQLTWLPELPIYTILGVEALQGDQELFGATLSEDEQSALGLHETDDGPRLFTLFAKIAPDIGDNQALQIGLSYAHARQQQLAQEHTHDQDGDHDDDHEDHDHDHDVDDLHDDLHAEPEIHRTGLEGDASLWGLDLVYKYDGGGADGKGDFKFQTEYLRSTKDMKIRSSAHPEQIGAGRTFVTDGLYAQALYGFAPKWKAGLRYDVLGLTNEIEDGESFGSSERWTLDLTWSLSEFSQLRAQYARSDILVAENERERFDAFYLQFLMSLGSHGAHSF